MNDSHEVITLELMARCLSDAEGLLLNGTMSFDDYMTLFEEAVRLIRGKLMFAQDNGLEIQDGEETEAWRLMSKYDYFSVMDRHTRDVSQGDRSDLSIDRESSPGTLVVEPGSGAMGKPIWLVYSYDLTSFVRQQASVLESHNWDVA